MRCHEFRLRRGGRDGGVPRKRLSYASVVATLALVLAVGGGTAWATNYIIISTHQIKPSVLKKLHGANGKNGKNGTNGTNGTNGAPGTPGVFNRTRLNWPEGTPSTSSATFVSLRSLGTVTKQQASTVLRITVQTDVFQVGAGFCVYQVRVDGNNDSGSSDATIATGSTGTEAVVDSAGNAVPATIVAVFGGLAAGSHTVAIYAADVSATSCLENSGGFLHSAFVEETT